MNNLFKIALSSLVFGFFTFVLIVITAALLEEDPNVWGWIALGGWVIASGTLFIVKRNR